MKGLQINLNNERLLMLLVIGILSGVQVFSIILFVIITMLTLVGIINFLNSFPSDEHNILPEYNKGVGICLLILFVWYNISVFLLMIYGGVL